MTLFLYCKNCNKEIKVKGRFTSRWDITTKKGKEFELHCSKCNQRTTYCSDDVKAKSGLINDIALLLLFPCILTILWFLYPYSTKGIIPMFLLPMGVLIPSLIYAAILRDQKRKIETFNSTRPKSLRTFRFTKKY